eukprot:10895656-Ditylum_brightwellii.AAC.1
MADGSVDDGETAVDDNVTMGDSVNVMVGGNEKMGVGNNVDSGDVAVGIEGDDYYCYHHDSNFYGQLSNCPMRNLFLLLKLFPCRSHLMSAV